MELGGDTLHTGREVQDVTRALVTSKKYLPKREPWAHQKVGLDRIRGQRHFALLMQMRTGKTLIDLTDFGRRELSGDVCDKLVHAPAGAYRTWETAMEENFSEDLQRRALVYRWESGAGVRHLRDLDTFMRERSRPRVLLMNTEAVSSVKRAREVCVDFLSQRRGYSEHTVDEATSIKNHDSERTKFIVDTLSPLSTWRRILTGLPTPRSPLDAYMQFKFLDRYILGFGSWHAFAARHSVMQEIRVGAPRRLPNGELARDSEGNIIQRTIKVPVAYRNEVEIRDKIAPVSYRVLLEDCYDLPPKMYSFRDVEWHPEQRRIYKQLREFATAEIEEGKHVTAHQVITQILRLHQVLCGHTKTEEGEDIEIPNHRIPSLLDLLEEHEGKAVVWCSYDLDVRAVSEAIAKRFDSPVARFWGGNRKTRESEERMFQSDPSCRHMVATPDAGGMGRQWGVADLVVHYSNRDNLEHREQSEFRTQIVGKTRSVGHVDMRIPGTVEDKIIEALRKKINMASLITGDNWKQWLI